MRAREPESQDRTNWGTREPGDQNQSGTQISDRRSEIRNLIGVGRIDRSSLNRFRFRSTDPHLRLNRFRLGFDPCANLIYIHIYIFRDCRRCLASHGQLHLHLANRDLRRNARGVPRPSAQGLRSSKRARQPCHSVPRKQTADHELDQSQITNATTH